MTNKLLVIDLVGLNAAALAKMPGLQKAFAKQAEPIPLQPPLPALTCSAQATLLTGALPQQHGIVSNGWFFEETGESRFWLRSDRLVRGEKVWDALKAEDPSLRVANLFWRFATHSRCDFIVTERPTYWANGRKSPDIFTTPDPLRDELVQALGAFPLFRFWGPATSIESSQWIADATAHVMKTRDPHLTLTYLPHLDYDLQKFGPQSEQAATACAEIDAVATRLVEQARELGRSVMVLSEYGITEVSKPVYLNRCLREAGWIRVQRAENGELLEGADSEAFALCSHQIAHIHVRDEKNLADVKCKLESLPGVERVLDAQAMKEAGLAHDRAGQLFAIAEQDAWFAYPYWLDDADAPDFARCVAIHDKPGHDPLEMFLGPGGKSHVIKRILQSKLGFRVPFDVISQDATRIGGSHGRLPDSLQEGPLLLTDCDGELADSLAMTEIKSLMLQQVLGSA
ncbi:MAG: alkaline phosphatase family protein [Planctomycetaceae bacterium]|nr:alkaline phosphatase family protein [Planctomycetaceae bacterium]MCP4461322.1 alkaline phosphatase family protein [Planctomycetaceae bacterium]MDG1809338.1 alkaline phosphatase family protein [Pirellulaceae bacterium]MDG2105900.1 alkaline phosphatase family protein [Pirellulaceae bacterium]